MNHDEYLSRVLALTDADAAAVLAHADSCAACRRDQILADRSLARLSGTRRRSGRLEDTANVAAVAAVVAIAISALWSWNPRPAATSARYRIVGGGSGGVVAYTPTETIVVAGERLPSAPSDPKESQP